MGKWGREPDSHEKRESGTCPHFPTDKKRPLPWKTEAAKTRLGLQVLNDQIAHSNGANNLIGGSGGVL